MQSGGPPSELPDNWKAGTPQGEWSEQPAASRGPNGAETGEQRSPTYSPAGCAATAQNAVGEYGTATLCTVGRKERAHPKEGWAQRCAGGDVLSHQVTPAVPSARQSLTTVFGMGTGVSSALRPPATNVEAVKQASSKQRVEKRRGRPQEGPTHVQACVSLK